MIHKDNVEQLGTHLLNGFRTTARLRQVKSIALQETSGDFPVDYIIIHHKYLYIRRSEGFHGFHLVMWNIGHLRNRTPVYDLLWNGNGNYCPGAICALHSNSSLHHLHKMFHNGKTKASAFHASVSFGICLPEIFKDFT